MRTFSIKVCALLDCRHREGERAVCAVLSPERTLPGGTSCFLSKEDSVASSDPNSVRLGMQGFGCSYFWIGFCFFSNRSEPSS